jgi:hypothetical protein
MPWIIYDDSKTGGVENSDNCFSAYHEIVSGCCPDFSVWMKRDGCMEFYRYFNGASPLYANEGYEDNVEQMHICDIDDMIKVLHGLREFAAKYFDE